MTREEFMDIVYDELHSDGDNYRANRIIDAADEYAEEQTRWIPISERLPEEFKSVLVCYKSQGGKMQCVTERIVDFLDGSTRWSGMCGQKPIAWMPLPQSFKAESEE